MRCPSPQSLRRWSRVAVCLAALPLLGSACATRHCRTAEAMPPATPTTPARAAPALDKAAEAALMACAAIDAELMSRAPHGQVNLDRHTSEGGSGDVFKRGDAVTKIAGGLMGESFQFDFAYVYAGDHVCARETLYKFPPLDHPDHDKRPLWFVKTDRRIFAGTRLLYEDSAGAPGDQADSYHSPQQTAAFARKIRTLAAKPK